MFLFYSCPAHLYTATSNMKYRGIHWTSLARGGSPNDSSVNPATEEPLLQFDHPVCWRLPAMCNHPHSCWEWPPPLHQTVHRKKTRQYWTQCHPLRNKHPQFGHAQDISLLTTKPCSLVFHQPCGLPIRPLSLQIHMKWDQAKGPVEVKVNDIHCSSLILQANYLTEGNQANSGTICSC